MENDEEGGSPTIRLATVGDASVLAEVGARLFEDAFGSANKREDMEMYLRGAFGNAIQRAELMNPDRKVLVVENVEGNVTGYAMLALGTQGEGVSGERPVEIQRFYIDRKWHGRGLADLLMDACIDESREWQCDVIWLAVWEKNGRAIAFYTRRGFRRVGEKTFVLGHDKQNDHVMSLSLS